MEKKPLLTGSAAASEVKSGCFLGPGACAISVVRPWATMAALYLYKHLSAPSPREKLGRAEGCGGRWLEPWEEEFNSRSECLTPVRLESGRAEGKMLEATGHKRAFSGLCFGE